VPGDLCTRWLQRELHFSYFHNPTPTKCMPDFRLLFFFHEDNAIQLRSPSSHLGARSSPCGAEKPAAFGSTRMAESRTCADKRAGDLGDDTVHKIPVTTTDLICLPYHRLLAYFARMMIQLVSKDITAGVVMYIVICVAVQPLMQLFSEGSSKKIGCMESCHRRPSVRHPYSPQLRMN
jgi:hypothetical protein